MSVSPADLHFFVATYLLRGELMNEISFSLLCIFQSTLMFFTRYICVGVDTSCSRVGGGGGGSALPSRGDAGNIAHVKVDYRRSYFALHKLECVVQGYRQGAPVLFPVRRED